MSATRVRKLRAIADLLEQHPDLPPMYLVIDGTGRAEALPRLGNDGDDYEARNLAGVAVAAVALGMEVRIDAWKLDSEGQPTTRYQRLHVPLADGSTLEMYAHETAAQASA